MYSKELYHHGIKGQRWGVRRYQNEDGSLTSAGQARYNKDGTKKNPKDMSDEDLRKSNQRLQAERQYNELTGKAYKNSSFSNTTFKAGVSAAGSFLAVAGAMALKDAIKGQKVNIGKAAAAGGLAAFGGAVASVVNSLGGQITKNGKDK